jgi:uncharacterized membrane protein
MGIAFVYAGSYFAPKKQFEVSVVLLAIIMVLSVVSFLGSAMPNSSTGPLLGLADSTLVAVGAIGAVYFIRGQLDQGQ